MRWSAARLGWHVLLAAAAPGLAWAQPGPPLPRSPITHVIFLLQENHTFDNYFGEFPGVDGAVVGRTSQHGVVPLAPMTDRPAGANHFWPAAHTGWNQGEMNGFDLIDGAVDQFGRLDSYVQADRTLIPNYWRLAETFVLGDNFFSSEMADSYTNHIFTFAGQAAQVIGATNVPYGCDAPSTTTVELLNGSFVGCLC